MDYKQAYEKTLEDLFFASREIEERDRREEKNLIVLSELNGIISLQVKITKLCPPINGDVQSVAILIEA
jgi:dihydroneopterin aldolase